MAYPPPETYHLPIFGGAEVQRWDPEPLPSEGQTALDRFLALPPSALDPVSHHVFAYYNDMLGHLNGKGWPGVPLPNIAQAADVWDHVTPTALYINQGDSGDPTWHIGVEAKVPWEANRGLSLYWANGDRITKVGPVDGWTSNAAAYADEGLVGTVYAAMDQKWTTRNDGGNDGPKRF